MATFEYTLPDNFTFDNFIETLTDCYETLGATAVTSLNNNTPADFGRTFKYQFGTNNNPYQQMHQTFRCSVQSNTIAALIRNNRLQPSYYNGEGGDTYGYNQGFRHWFNIGISGLKIIGYSSNDYLLISFSLNNTFLFLIGGLKLNSPWINTRQNESWVMGIVGNYVIGEFLNTPFLSFIHLSPNPIGTAPNYNIWRIDFGGNKINGRLPDGTIQIFPLIFTNYNIYGVAPALIANIPDLVCYSSELLTYNSPVTDGTNTYQTLYLPANSQLSMALGIKL